MYQMQNTPRQAKDNQAEREIQVVNIQRNPYLAEYDTSRRVGSSRATTGSTRRGRKSRRTIGLRQLLMLVGCIGAFVMGIWFYCVITDTPDVDGRMPSEPVDGVDMGEAISQQKIQGIKASDYEEHPAWTEDFLTVNDYSRPGEALKNVKSIFVHYTANPGTSAAQNRSYFEQLKDSRERSASAHFIIGYEGEILQCVPLNEIAYAVQGRNYDSISIECCHLEKDGSFTQETYDSLIKLLQWLVEVYDLDTEDILRHYDCGGKKCPLYYTENEEEWEQLKRDVGSI